MSQSGSYNSGGGGGGSVTTITGNSGGAVSPSAGNIDLVGAGGVLVTGNPGTHTLTITAPGGGSGINTLDGDTGSATGTTVTIAGGSNINTSATMATLTVNLDDTVSITGSMTAGTGFTATTGDVDILAGNINLPATTAGLGEGAININSQSFMHSFGTQNTFLGEVAGNGSLTGADNTGIGLGALSSISSGQRNVAVGSGAMENADTSSTNVSIGWGSLTSMSGGGNNNCAIGGQAGSSVTTGSSNVIIGERALLSATSASNNIIIGTSSAGAYASTESSNIIISNNGVAAESNVIRIGTAGAGAGQQNRAFMAGVYGVTPAMSPQMAVVGSDGELGSQSIPSGGIVTLNGDSGSATGSTVTIAGGSNITTSATGSTVTVDLDSTVSIGGSMTAATGLTVSSFGSGIVSSSSAGVFSSINGTDGQVIIAATGGDPMWASLTPGTGITITPAANSITIAANGTGFAWTEVTGTSVSTAVNNGYILNNGSSVSATLPATASVGDIIEIIGKGSGGWTVNQNTGQKIHFGNQDTTTGVTGGILSTHRYDCLSLICITANTDFLIRNSVGNPTIA